MNRRSFLVRLGLAAAGAAATQLLDDDPERLIWTPGAKTIIDLGAGKQVLPATDAEVKQVFVSVGASYESFREQFASQVHDGLLRDPLNGPRDIRLDIFSGGSQTTFRYRRDLLGEQLVSLHTAEELALLDKPMLPTWQPNVPRDVRQRPPMDWSLIDVPEDDE